MIISASRRTDIPAFYSTWFINRIRAGFCEVKNPFNSRQTSRVSLLPQDVDVIVFWTRNALPLMQYLDELDRLGYSYYFLYTVTPYEHDLDGKNPSLQKRIDGFIKLARKIGRDKVHWRYDPIVIGSKHDLQYHEEQFFQLTEKLHDFTESVIISFVDYYKKTLRNMAGLDEDFVQNPEELPGFGSFVRNLVGIAKSANLQIFSCAETRDLQKFGVRPGKCIDDKLIRDVFGKVVSSRKDPGQRKECHCVVSKDIGAYDSCLYDCRYCYASSNLGAGEKRFLRHDSNSASLV
ncbi:MAG: DUF1848 domain-containing protein [Calditrichaeota bacterium]|nr:DUF1848 domain-containing protein [Calditrichota bacterium]